MLPWQQVCNGKHFSKLDKTSYDNGVEFPSMDICQINVKHQARFSKNSYTQSAQFCNKTALF